jgi:hypothetical protein
MQNAADLVNLVHDGIAMFLLFVFMFMHSWRRSEWASRHGYHDSGETLNFQDFPTGECYSNEEEEKDAMMSIRCVIAYS